MNALCLLAWALAVPDWDLRIVEMYVCDKAGVKQTYALGEGPVYLCVKVAGEGSGSGVYELDVEFAGRKHRYTDRRPPRGTESYILTLGLAAHGAMPYRAEVDPDQKLDKKRGNNIAEGVLNPTTPVESEWFAPREYDIVDHWEGELVSGTPEKLVVATPIFGSMSHQTVESWTKDASSAIEYVAPDRAPALTLRLADVAKPVSLEQKAHVVVRNYRVNPAALNVPWAAYDSLPYDVRSWLTQTGSEEGIEALAKFYEATFPVSPREGSSPLAATVKAYMATLTALEYQADGHGALMPTLRDGVARCEGYAELYVGLVRKMGIPARIVNGYVADEGEGPKAPKDAHSWVEVWFPGVGWVPQDPTFADTAADGATYPCFFYVMPSLNERVAVSYGVNYRLEEGAEGYGLIGPSHWMAYKGAAPKLKTARTLTIETVPSRKTGPQ